MTRAPGRIAIAGAGIAGLTAALFFSRAGFAVSVFERAERLEQAGAGIQLSPNATRILDRLGVLDLLSPRAVRPQRVEIRRAADMRPLAHVPLGDAAVRRWGAPYLTVHRADLQDALLEAVARRGDIDIEYAATAGGFKAGPSLSIRDSGTVKDQPCLLAVGADGVWSALRRGGEGAQSRYTGYLAWRAMAEPAAGLLPADQVTTWLHPGFHLVAYPVRAGAAINLVAVTKSPAAPERWSNAADPALLAAAMKGASTLLVDLVTAAGPWTTWPIHQAPAEASWTDPAGFALIGDAAHAMSPYAAQGAAMAIEDAAVLSAAVTRSPGDLAAALGAYEALRRARVKRVAARGAFNRFAWHAAGPVALARDFVLSRRPPEKLAADLDWLYGFDAERPG